MSLIDGLLAQFGSLDEIAAKIGVSPEQVKSLSASVAAQVQSGDNPLQALSAAAIEHGISLEGLKSVFGNADLSAVIGQVQQGGLGAILGNLDKDGDGNPLNDLGGLAKGLFGS